MGLKLVTPPASYPVTVSDLKDHLRVDFTDDDDLIEAILQAAIAAAEEYTGRSFIDQTWDYYLDAFPDEGKDIELPNPPLIEVTGLYYRDTAGDEQEYSASNYLVDETGQKARIALAYGQSWPTIQERINAIRVRFRAGYLKPDSPDAAYVPFDIKAAIKLIAGTLYEHRESVVIGQIATVVPMSAEFLLKRHRVHTAMG